MQSIDNSQNKLINVASTQKNLQYEKMVKREKSLYRTESDIRSPFARDYTRILHSTAYRRLKHKTQVFYNIESDHICTRMEHVLHVESVSYTIAKHLGLNEELTKAIAMGHDLGHAPFGHFGEKVINEIYEKRLGKTFWHERNGLYLVDKIELLPDHDNVFKNLDLTYAVRDGIISHCGETDIKGIKPRTEYVDLMKDFDKTGKFSPITFEGCVVKMADKIAYVGRDIEDAINLGFLSQKDLNELSRIVDIKDNEFLNTSTIMNGLIIDVCSNSSEENGICLSDEKFQMLNRIKRFNYDYIYSNKRFEAFKKYASLIITEVFDILANCYNKGDVFEGLNKEQANYQMLIAEFSNYLIKYCEKSVLSTEQRKQTENYNNEKIYGKLNDEKLFMQAILDFIAGMTDRYAVKLFNSLITY